MDLIETGVNLGLVTFNEDCSKVTYIDQNKSRNANNPEELVQLETYLQLVLTYRYSPNRIKMFVPVTMGREVKEADIIVYNDDACSEPYILVECKKTGSFGS